MKYTRLYFPFYAILNQTCISAIFLLSSAQYYLQTLAVLLVMVFKMNADFFFLKLLFHSAVDYI